MREQLVKYFDYKTNLFTEQKFDEKIFGIEFAMSSEYLG